MYTASQKVIIVHYAEPVPDLHGRHQTRYGSVSRELKKMGHEVTRYFPSFLHRTRSESAHESFFYDETYGAFRKIETRPYTTSRSYHRIRFLQDFEAGVMHRIRQDRPSLVLVGLPQVGIASAIKKEFKDIRVFVDVRDLWPDAQLESASGLKFLGVLLWSLTIRGKVRSDLTLADGVIGISQAYLNWSAKQCGLSELSNSLVAPLGASVQETRFVVDKSRKGVVFVGSLSPLFDFKLLLDAWRHFSRNFPELAKEHQLHIVGDGDLADEIRGSIADLDNVTMHGYMDYNSALNFLSCSSVAVAPYLNGNFLTNKFFEYMSMGLPVVSTLTGEAKEIIHNNGVGINVGKDALAFGDAIAQLLDGVSYDNSMRDNAVNLVSTHFDRDAIGKKIANFITMRDQGHA